MHENAAEGDAPETSQPVSAPTSGTSQGNSGISGNLDLSVLSVGHPLRLTRSWPLFCEGYLTGLEVPEGGVEGILEVVRTTYGGGTYRLQNTRTVPNGSTQFASGHVTFKIAGNPIMNGREYAPDGTMTQSAVGPGVQPTVLMQPPAPGGSGTESRMLAMLQGALERAASGGQHADLGGIVSAVREMREMVPTPAPALDQFGQFEQFMGMMQKMQRFQSAIAGEGAADAPAGLLGDGDGMLEKMLLAKIMGGDGPQRPQPAPQPGAYPGQHVVHGPQPGYYGGQPQSPYGAHPGPQQQAYQYPQHPPHTYPPQQEQPQPPPTTQVPPTAQPPPAAQPPPTQSDEDEEEYEPITAPDVVEQIKSLGEAEQMAFLSDMLEGLGMPGGLAGIASSINGGSHGVNFSTAVNPNPTQ